MWNINDIDNYNNDYIELFSNSVCCDQELPLKFGPSIATTLRSQIQKHKGAIKKCIKSGNMNNFYAFLHES